MYNGNSVSLECPVLCCRRRYNGARSRDCLRDHLREFSLKCAKHSESYVQLFPSARRSGRMQFDCSICSRQFTRQSVLKRHMETHCSKRHHCPKCGKKFRQYRNVREHLTKKRCKYEKVAGYETIQENLECKDNDFRLSLDPNACTRDGQAIDKLIAPLSEPTPVLQDTSFQTNGIMGVTDSVRNFDLSTLVQPYGDSPASDFAPSFDLSTLVEDWNDVPVNNSTLTFPCGDNGAMPATKQPFDLPTLTQESSCMTETPENFDLSTLVYPYQPPLLSTEIAAPNFPCHESFTAQSYATA